MLTNDNISIRLTPNASSNRIGESRLMPNGETQLSVYVTSIPEDGKANDAMIKLLAKHLNLAPSRLTIIRGHTSRNKVVKIDLENY